MFKDSLHAAFDNISPSPELLDRVSLMLKEEAAKKKPPIAFSAARYAGIAAAVTVIAGSAVIAGNLMNDSIRVSYPETSVTSAADTDTEKNTTDERSDDINTDAMADEAAEYDEAAPAVTSAPETSAKTTTTAAMTTTTADNGYINAKVFTGEAEAAAAEAAEEAAPEEEVSIQSATVSDETADVPEPRIFTEAAPVAPENEAQIQAEVPADEAEGAYGGISAENEAQAVPAVPTEEGESLSEEAADVYSLAGGSADNSIVQELSPDEGPVPEKEQEELKSSDESSDGGIFLFSDSLPEAQDADEAYDEDFPDESALESELYSVGSDADSIFTVSANSSETSDPATGAIQSYEDFAELLTLPAYSSYANFVSFEITDTITPEEAYEITGKEYFLPNADGNIMSRLYRARAVRDLLFNEDLDEEFYIARADADGEYTVGETCAAYLYGFCYGSEHCTHLTAMLLYSVTSLDGELYARPEGKNMYPQDIGAELDSISGGIKDDWRSRGLKLTRFSKIFKKYKNGEIPSPYEYNEEGDPVPTVPAESVGN